MSPSLAVVIAHECSPPAATPGRAELPEVATRVAGRPATRRRAVPPGSRPSTRSRASPCRRSRAATAQVCAAPALTEVTAATLRYAHRRSGARRHHPCPAGPSGDRPSKTRRRPPVIAHENASAARPPRARLRTIRRARAGRPSIGAPMLAAIVGPEAIDCTVSGGRSRSCGGRPPRPRWDCKTMGTGWSATRCRPDLARRRCHPSSAGRGCAWPRSLCPRPVGPR